MRKAKSHLFYDIYNQPYDDSTRLKLYSSSKSSLQLIQRMALLKRLKIHDGCVNSICWNSTGELILSGSDDQHLVLTDAYNYQVLTNYKTSHRANIFSAKFLPNSGDHRIVSCSGDGIILYTDLMRRMETFLCQFKCHSGTTYEIATVPGEPHSFLSCGEDGTVRWFDLRVKDKCSVAVCTEDVLIYCQKAVTALSVNPIAPHQIAIGCSDSTVRIFDRRMLGTIATGWVDNGDAKRPLCSFTVPEFDGNSYRITSLSYSPDGQDVLVSYSSDHLYLFSVKDQGSVHLRKDSKVGKTKGKKQALRSPQPVRRLRLRGDWSDTGPDARPEREGGRRSHSAIAQARPVLHTSLMQRMTDVLSRMLNDPATRAALNGGGEDSLESVIDEQVNSQANQDNSAVDNSEDRSNESVDHSEDSREVVSQVDRTGSTTAEDDHDEPEDTENSLAFNNSEEQGMGLEESRETPMETESSQNESQRTDDPSEETNNKNEETDESVEERKGNMMQNLQDKLTTMRDGFLERHRSEPAVSLTYSDISSTSATISLGVADELIRDTYHAGPSGSQGRTQDDVNPGPSNSRLQFSNGRENVDQDTYIDSDDDDDDDEEEDDAPPNQTASGSRCFQHGCSNPMETDVNNAIANALSSQKLQGQEIFDETYLTELGVKQKYMGHRNARTMIKEANFWGDDFVMSGSDCGHVFVWERDTAKLCMLLEADQHVVNCLQPHPYLPILATSGIDYDVKLWAPINSESSFDEKFADDLKKRNAVMLEETKDTITVPAVFMIRMLACLNQIRRGRGRNRRRSGGESDGLGRG